MCPTTSSPFPARTISDLQSAFQMLDADRDGKISHQDLKASYAGADDDLIGTMITVADLNNDGFVEFEEFEKMLKTTATANANGSGGVLEDVFRAMDEDGDGKVGCGDLRSYLSCAGIEVDDEEIKAMIKLGDVDGEIDGVTFDEFLKILAV